MKWLAFMLLFVATPVFAQSFRGPDQRPWRQGNATKVNNANVPASQNPVSTNASGQLVAPTVQGNGTKVQLSTGSTTTNDCVKFDANGNTVDTGAGCSASTFATAMSASVAMVNYGGL